MPRKKIIKNKIKSSAVMIAEFFLKNNISKDESINIIAFILWGMEQSKALNINRKEIFDKLKSNIEAVDKINKTKKNGKS